MKNNSFFKKYKSIIIILLLLLVWIIFVTFLILPAKNSLRESFISVEKKKLDNEVGDDKLKKLPVLEDNFNLIERGADNLDVIFSKDKIVELVKELEFIADRTGNKINISVADENKIVAVVPDKTKGLEGAEKFTAELPNKNYFKIKLVLTGDYASLIKFIDKLNNIKYYNTISSLALTSVKEVIEKEENVVSANGGISLMSSGDISSTNVANSTEIDKKDRLILESNLEVLFYTLENKDENK